MAENVECAICLQEPDDPYEIPSCKHFFCHKCFDTIKANPDFLCPLCRQVFRKEDIVPHRMSARANVTTYGPQEAHVDEGEETDEDPGFIYCRKLTCSSNSGCRKVHIDDICTFPLTNGRPKPRPNVVDTVDDRPKFTLPMDSTYCGNISCPGGPNSRCGKIHESDILSTF